MKDFCFIFDLDGTISQVETVPVIAELKPELKNDILDLTNSTVRGELPFEEGFSRRVELLKKIRYDLISDTISSIAVYPKIKQFINNSPGVCRIATGNLDVWVDKALSQFKCKSYSSVAEITAEGELIGIKSFLSKKELVKELKNQGKIVVFIGDGNNDVEAMLESDIAIAMGAVHQPAESVMLVADYAVFSEASLLLLLETLKTKLTQGAISRKTAVLLAAGAGSRLSLNTTKAMLKFGNKRLVEIHLERLNHDFDEIFVVVGFQMKEVIAATKEFHSKVIFTINHSYLNFGPAYSLWLVARHLSNLVMIVDSDVFITTESYNRCVEIEHEFLGYSHIRSAEPVYVQVIANKANSFSYKADIKHQWYEWTGPLKIHSKRIGYSKGSIFEMLSHNLPFSAEFVDAFDVDTPQDYQYALKNYNNYL